ncbi:hypothetical protein [Deinococcus multiflagellatus]|uniref:Uncharacterized protein n=1 Tax=Deinococcus multiflagellatus TaxID=1656887 RepID=A0ABW1ZGU4_9DEIO|nr:hypothetical protein [Deinococcus multiflagellatus]MBZ9711944.1 hypothetical protein [Deinococcus multiflagellatus]
MKRALTLFALLLPSVASAGSGSVSLTFRVTVQAVCQLHSQTPEQITLRCTRDFVPADPHALPELAGKLPLATLRLSTTSPYSGGGTLNTYALERPSGESSELIFY